MNTIGKLWERDGQVFFPVYYPAGGMSGELESFQILESFEKRTKDHSSNRWFPQILVEQRCKLQRLRGISPAEMRPVGDPFEAWILLENESTALPFVADAHPPPA